MKHLFQVMALVFMSLYHCDMRSQSSDLPINYYLPDIQYDAKIPTPQQYLGFQIGEWHVTHDQIVGYFKALDAASDRIELREYARTHENKPLIVAMISNPANIKNKDKIKKAHAELSSSETSMSVDINQLPAVVWQGYSIHGNEASGCNAAMLVAYYLVAGNSSEVEATLENCFILLDPCLNPDGSQRFSTWVNSHRSANLVSDPASREFSESWPGGRYNHYWFDMNRDWLLLVHPESRGRIKMMHEWHPNIVTDHHEMSTNSTFFFQPGIPASNNPNTPKENFELTEAIGKYHGRALDSIGSLYYTKDNFDDFYYGKGSTYPDAIGAIGILFEQASSRGHIQQSVNGPLRFSFTIRNQVVTSLSTQKAAVALKNQLLTYKRNFHKLTLNIASTEPIKGYIFTDKDAVKANHFLNILLQHHIDVYVSDQNQTINGQFFGEGKSYIVPMAQSNPILAKTIFEQVKTFQNSSFYDVSGWTMTDAFGISAQPLPTVTINKKLKVNSLVNISGKIIGTQAGTYAYIIAPNQWNIHKAVYSLQDNQIVVRVAKLPFQMAINGKNIPFAAGSVIVPVNNQSLSRDEIHALISKVAESNALEIFASPSGNGTEIITLGHPSMGVFEKPRAAVIVGNGMSPQSVGEIWHHMDLNLGCSITMLEIISFRNTNLAKYNTLILAEGNYSWGETEINKLREWCQSGNTLITIGGATEWAADKKLVNLTMRKTEKPMNASGIYINADQEGDAKIIGGSIFNSEIDNTHPIFYGIESKNVAFMKSGTKFYDPTINKFATPARYKDDFLLSGYLPKGIDTTIKGAASVTVHSIGNGKVICFQDNPLFRGYWLAGQKVFNNSLFYGKLIERNTTESE